MVRTFRNKIAQFQCLIGRIVTTLYVPAGSTVVAVSMPDRKNSNRAAQVVPPGKSVVSMPDRKNSNAPAMSIPAACLAVSMPDRKNSNRRRRTTQNSRKIVSMPDRKNSNIALS